MPVAMSKSPVMATKKSPPLDLIHETRVSPGERTVVVSSNPCDPEATPIVKTAREQLDILTAYHELGSYRAAAALCGTTHKTVRRVLERRDGPVTRAAATARGRPIRYRDLIARRIKATDGRISAKRLLPACRAEGYTGSARTLRRAVHEAKADHRRQRRVYRPWQPVPGEHLVIDWGVIDGLHVFCAVLAWSRVRFVRFAEREDQATTLRLLAECFEILGGVPAVVLADRMGCLKGGVVANVVVPAPGYVAFARHYGFRPDFCEAADPESKGVVEHLVGYAKRDLVIGCGPFGDVASANRAAIAWCDEVNGRIHSETSAVPDERLVTERTLLRPLPSLRPAIGIGPRPDRRPPADGALRLRPLQRPGCLHRQAGRGQRRRPRHWSSATPAPRSPGTRSWDPAR